MPPKPKQTRTGSKANAHQKSVELHKSPQPDLPTPEMLASIAGVVSKDFEHKPDSAVNHAFDLWTAAKNRLNAELKEFDEMAFQDNVLADLRSKIEMPDKFPATLDDFLQGIVGCKKVKERTGRFREFLKNQYGDKDVETQMESMRKDGFVNQFVWLNTGMDYKEWWKKDKSKKSRLAREARGLYKFPEKYPATLEDFYNEVVRGKKDRETRFREFLKSNPVNVYQKLEEFQKNGFKDEKAWRTTADNYLSWWKDNKEIFESRLSKPSKWSSKALQLTVRR
jgi:hypothetical protein